MAGIFARRWAWSASRRPARSCGKSRLPAIWYLGTRVRATAAAGSTDTLVAHGERCSWASMAIVRAAVEIGAVGRMWWWLIAAPSSRPRWWRRCARTACWRGRPRPIGRHDRAVWRMRVRVSIKYRRLPKSSSSPATRGRRPRRQTDFHLCRNPARLSDDGWSWSRTNSRTTSIVQTLVVDVAVRRQILAR